MGNRNEFRKTFKEENPDVKGVAAVGKAGGERWKSMSDAVRCLLLARCVYMLEKLGRGHGKGCWLRRYAYVVG